MPELHAQLGFDADGIVDTVREPLLVLDANLRVQRANRSFLRTFGVSWDQTINRLVYDLGDGQWNIPRLRTLLEEILPEKTSFDDFEVEHDFQGVGRKVMLLNGRCIDKIDNHTQFILLAIEDVTERRQAEEGRRELETRFTSLVKNIKDHAIFTMDAAGNVTSWNVEAERILGYSEGEILGKPFSIIFTPEDVQKGMPDWELRKAREEGRSEDERWHVRKNGEPFWVVGIVTPTRDASGHHTGFSKILRDMTDQKHAEETRQQLARHAAELERQLEGHVAQLQETNTALEAFSSSVSHDLRAPLRAMHGIALALLEDYGDRLDPLGQDYARRIVSSAQHMDTLIQDLLAYSRLSRADLRTLPVNMQSVVAEVLVSLQDEIDQQKAQVAVKEPLPPVVAHRPTLVQMVTNLLTNALKFATPGVPPKVLVQAEERQGMVRLWVEDNGIGIAPSHRQRIFDVFERLHGDEQYPGTGIGLAIVRKGAERMGGRAGVESAPGQGSQFWIELPKG